MFKVITSYVVIAFLDMCPLHIIHRLICNWLHRHFFLLVNNAAIVNKLVRLLFIMTHAVYTFMCVFGICSFGSLCSSSREVDCDKIGPYMGQEQDTC